MAEFGCPSCRRFGGLFKIGGTHKVKCVPIGLKNLPLPGTCSGWVGSDLLEGLPEWADTNADVKKWHGRD